jgi:hypothetical protein
MRAPGEAIPPEERAVEEFDITKFDPVSALRSLQPVLDNPRPLTDADGVAAWRVAEAGFADPSRATGILRTRAPAPAPPADAQRPSDPPHIGATVHVNENAAPTGVTPTVPAAPPNTREVRGFATYYNLTG